MHVGMMAGSPVVAAMPGNVGTTIGNLTGADGLAAAFDGNSSTMAYAPDWNHTHCIGKKWPEPLVLQRLYAMSGANGFSYASQYTTHNILVQGSQDTSNGVDGTWTTLYSTSITNTYGTRMYLDVTPAQGLIITTAYLAHRLFFQLTNWDGLSFQSSHAVAELTLYATTMM